MQKYSKLSIKLFLIIVPVMLIYSSIAIFIHDPLQIWHKPLFRSQNRYSYTIRESAKAMIRDLDFDSKIIGSSFSENTSSKKAGEILGGKFLNLSISGSTLYEKNLILTYLQKRKPVNQIVYILDEHYFKLSKSTPYFDTAQYEFLYNENPFDDYKIYLNSRYLLRTILFSHSAKCVGKKRNIDRPYAWDKMKSHTNRFGGFEKWIEHKKHNQIETYFNSIIETPKEINNNKLDEQYITKMKEYFDNYLFTNIANAPDTKFYIIISPVCNLELARRIRDKQLTFEKQVEMFKYLVSQQSKYNNFEIYAFNDTRELGEIKYYKDGTHYETWMNYSILENIKNKKHRIDSTNVDKYLDNVKKLAKSVDFEYYYKKIEETQNKK